MTIKLFYKSSSEGSDQGLEDIQRDLTEYGADCHMLDVDSIEGTSDQELYDVTQFPSIIVVGNDGSVIRRWSGLLPTAADVRYALGAI